MKTTILYFLVVCLVLHSELYAQEEVIPEATITRNDIISPTSEEASFSMEQIQPLSEQNFKRVLNREFTSLLSSLSSLSVGNYLAVDQKDSKAELAFSRVLKGGGILGVELTGSAPGGVIVFADNSRATYNFSIGAQYHFFNREKGRNVSVNQLVALRKEKGHWIKK